MLSISALPPYPARWQTHAVTVAGGHGNGNGTHQLSSPHGLFVDEDQTVYIADYANHRIMGWRADADVGQVLAGGNGLGSRLNQLNYPTDVTVDGETDTLLVCDRSNARVMRWPRRPASSPGQGEIVLNNIGCYGLTMDGQGALYLSDPATYEVRRYDKGGDKKGAVVAGGHGRGGHLNQLDNPTFLFVDAQSTLYVSDSSNNRVMKWMKGAREGSVGAGRDGPGDDSTQLP